MRNHRTTANVRQAGRSTGRPDDGVRGADHSRFVPRRRGVIWHPAIRRPIQALVLVVAAWLFLTGAAVLSAIFAPIS